MRRCTRPDMHRDKWPPYPGGLWQRVHEMTGTNTSQRATIAMRTTTTISSIDPPWLFERVCLGWRSCDSCFYVASNSFSTFFLFFSIHSLSVLYLSTVIFLSYFLFHSLSDNFLKIHLSFLYLLSALIPHFIFFSPLSPFPAHAPA